MNCARFGIGLQKAMRHSQAEKMEVMRLAEGSDLPVVGTLEKIRFNRSRFCERSLRYRIDVDDGVAANPFSPETVLESNPGAGKKTKDGDHGCQTIARSGR